MKKIIFRYIPVILLITATVMSCSKKIDITPEFQLDGSQPLTTVDQAGFVLTGAYSRFRSDGYFNSIPLASSVFASQPASFSGLPDMMSDDLVETVEDFPNYRDMSDWTYAADALNVDATFASPYSVISNINIILRDIDNIAMTDPEAIADAERVQNIKAQSLAIRAMAHFDLMRYFAPDFDRNSSNLALPYITVFNALAKPPRITVKAYYDSIYSDLNAALATFPSALNYSDLTRVSPTLVEALLARVSLYANQWQQSIDACTYVIDRVPLSDMSSFPEIWTDNSQAEIIWKVPFQSVSDGTPYENVFFARSNRCLYRPTESLMEEYDQTNDIRFGTYIDEVGTINDVPHLPRISVIKHIGKDGTQGGFVDWKAFRVAEFYLTRAEAYYQIGDETNALADLDAIRIARITGFTSANETGPALLDAIKTERRKELAFEGHRFFDLKRWDKTPIDRCAETNTISNICSLPHNSRSWALPIPESEISANPNITQNPGY